MSFSSVTKRSRSERPKISRRRISSSRRRRCPKPSRKRTDRKESKGVAERLEALKELIPSMGNGNGHEEKVTADEIFEEAADYILLLRTRVEILKQLVEFYGTGEENATVS